MSPCPNVTGTILAPTTTLNIIRAIVNSTYSLQVEASNAFGYGPATSIIAGKHINNNTGGHGMHEL